MRSFLFLLGCLLFGAVPAQVLIQGRVLDNSSQAPLAFVHVVPEGAREGATTGIDGRFALEVPALPVELRFSYVGYSLMAVVVQDAAPLVVRMAGAAVQLRPVEVVPGENPAHRIIERVHANRKVNDGMRQRAHRYISYSKMVFTADLDSAVRNDAARMSAMDTGDGELYHMMEKQHLFLMESATEKSFRPPAAEKETVLAMRVSGLKDPSLLALAAQTKTFSIYEPQIVLNERNYLSPIGPASTRHYLFLLEDTLYEKGDSVFVITFRPRSNTRFDGLKGLLYVNTDGYAVQNVIAEPMERSGGLGLKIQQMHARAGEGGPWFPKQLNTFFYLDMVQMENFRFVGIGRTYLKDIVLDVPIERREVRGAEVVMDKMAMRRDDAFWADLREAPLDERELMTYHVIDSLGEAEDLDAKLKWLSALTTGRFPVGPVDLVLRDFLWYDGYQGLRLGGGLATNDKVSPYFSLAGYGAYGFGDKEAKYGGSLAITPWPARDLELKGYYANDVAESGGVSFPGLSRTFDSESYRWFYVDRMDRQEKWGAQLVFRAGSSLKLWLGTERSQLVNVLGYQYAENAGEGITILRDQFLTGAITGAARFAFRERIARLPDREMALGTRWPILHVDAMVAQKGLWQGEYDLWRVNAMVEKTFHVRLWGDLKVRLMGGMARSDAPYPYLVNMRGTRPSNGLALATANTFETMRPNEFLADRYAAVHLQHSFGHLLFETRYFKPKPMLVTNLGIGALEHPELHRGYSFKALDQAYMESGLVLEEIVKLGFTGIGIGAYYRYGPLASGVIEEDLAVKMALSLAF